MRIMTYINPILQGNLTYKVDNNISTKELAKTRIATQLA